MFSQCGFVVQPAASISWYRKEGWKVPGVTDSQAIKPVELTVNGQRPDWPAGVAVSMIIHKRGYQVTFPAAIFEGDGKRKRMRPTVGSLRLLLRWEMNGKPYAYSYELESSRYLCTFSVDIVDDKGDGIFRTMVTPGHLLHSSHLPSPGPQPPPLPEWLKKPVS